MSELGAIENWPALAQQSRWCATTLAKQCHVSTRTLERHCLEQTGQPIKSRLAKLRLRLAAELLCQDLLVKEIAFRLGYKHHTHFSRQFKKHWGASPKQFQSQKLGWSHAAGRASCRSPAFGTQTPMAGPDQPFPTCSSRSS